MAQLKSSKILIVEDDPDFNEILCEVFSSEYLVVYSALNGLEALAILKSNPVDVVVCDGQMPVMDGQTLLLNIRSIYSSDISVLMVTGQSELSQQEARALGADLLLYKPVSIKQLLGAVNTLPHAAKK